MLRDLIACSCNDKGRACRDVEGVLTIATGSYNVEGAISVEVDVATSLKQSVTETKQFVNCDASHLQRHEQSRNLAIVILLLGDAQHDDVGLLACEELTFNDFVEIRFHWDISRKTILSEIWNYWSHLKVEKPVVDDFLSVGSQD